MADKRKSRRDFFGDKELVTKFIMTYKENRCLWDRRNIDYTNKVRRDTALDKLVAIARRRDPGVGRKTVWVRLQNMRGSVRRQRRRLLGARGERRAASLWYYDMLSFILRGPLGYKQPTTLAVDPPPYTVYIKPAPTARTHTMTQYIERKTLQSPQYVVEHGYSGVEYVEGPETCSIEYIEEELAPSPTAAAGRPGSYAGCDDEDLTHHSIEFDQEDQESEAGGSGDEEQQESFDEEFSSEYNIVDVAGAGAGAGRRRRGSEDGEPSAKRNKPATVVVDDEYDAIGINVAAKLRNLSSSQRILAEKLVNDVLYQAQVGALAPATCIYTPDPFKQDSH